MSTILWELDGLGRRLITMRNTASISILLGFVVASCSGSSGATPVATDAPTPAAVTTPVTDPPAATAPPATDDPPTVTFESEPIEAGPLFGSSDAASAAASDDAEVGGERCADDLDECANIDETQDDVDAVEPFTPAAADAPFCAKLDELAERPFPSDELEALVVAQAWFAELRPTVVAAILADFDVLNDWLDTAVDAQGQISFDDTDEAVERASDRLDGYVDRNCNGLDGDDPEPAQTEPTPPAAASTNPDDPPLPNGVTIPVIAITGPIDESPIPLFGSESDSGGVPEPEPGFSPEAADAPFCTALDIVNSRAQPSDDFEQLAVASQYLDAMVPIVPDGLADDFITLRAWVGPIVASGSFDDADEASDGDDVQAAIEAINDYVDSRCLGR